MKSKKTKPEAAASSPKSKAKVGKLKLNKETPKDLSTKDAGAIKGGLGAMLKYLATSVDSSQ